MQLLSMFCLHICKASEQIQCTSQPCLWLEGLLLTMHTLLHVHKAFEHISIWPLQILLWLEAYPAGLHLHKASEHSI